MYCDFFGLHALPFNNTPDPRFFFNTPDHEEALASLLYAAQERKGFVLVTGEVGSGKTLLSRLLVSQLGSTARTAIINNTRLTGRELLLALCREFELEVAEDANVTDLTHTLEQFLLEQYARDRLAVVILDEAQNLPMETFEELRMLGNLEADDAKLLQVLMLGQPELQDAFRAPSMRQLQQRIFRSFHLQALNPELTAGYIRHRLQVAGLPEGEGVFDAEAVAAVYHHSEGIPRLINQVCDNAMLAAYTESIKRVSGKLVDEVVEQMMALTANGPSTAPRNSLAGRHHSPPSASASASIGHRASHAAEDEVIETGYQPEASFGGIPRRRHERQPVDGMRRPGADPDPALDRLTVMEQRLTDQRRDRQPVDESSREASDQLEMLRQMRQQAADALWQTSSHTQEAADRIRDLHEQTRRLLDNARQSSEKIQQETTERFSESHRQTSALQEQFKQSLNHVLSEAKAATGDVAGSLRQLLEEERRYAEQTQRRTNERLDETQTQTSALQERVKKLLEEVRTNAGAQQQRGSQLDAQGQAELDAAKQLRQQASEALRGVTGVVQEAEQRLDDTLERAARGSQAIEEQTRTTLEEGVKQNAALQEQVKKLLEEVRTNAGAQQQRGAQLDAQGQVELDAAKQLRQQASEALHEVTGVVQEAKQRLNETEKQNAVIQIQARELVKEMHAYANGQQERITGLLSQERAEFEAAQQMRREAEEHSIRAAETIDRQGTQAEALTAQLEELAARLERRNEEVSGRSDEMLTYLEGQVRKMNEQFNGLRETARTRAEEQTAAMEAFMQQMRQRVGLSHQQLFDASSIAQNEVQAVRKSLNNTREQILDEAELARSRSNQILEQTGDLLIKTREQTAGLLVSLQAQITEQTEKAAKIWQMSITEGSKTLSELQTRLEQSRLLADRSRSDLESLVTKAGGELTRARDSFEAEINAHKTEIGVLAANAGNIRNDIAQRFEEARRDIEPVVEKHHQALRGRAVKVIGETDEYLNAAEARARRTTEMLETELKTASETADHIYTELQNSVGMLQQRADDYQDQCHAETQRLQDELAQFAERHHQAVQEAQGQADELTQQAEQATRQMADRIEELRSAAKNGVSQISQGLTACLKDTTAGAEKIRAEAKSSAAQLAERMKQTQNQAENAIHNAETAISSVREQSKSSLAELRATLTQINRHAEALQQDLVLTGDEVGDTAKKTMQELQQTTAGITEQIQSLRTSAHEGAEADYQRLAAMREQVDEGAEQIRQNAVRLLDQVQAGTASLRERADEMLTQARSGSEKIGEQAAKLLMQAHSSAERFREQAEALLRRAEASAENIRTEVGSLRSDLVQDAQQIREQVSGVKQDFAGAREEAVQVFNEAKEIQEAARRQAQQLIERADEINDQTGRLLRMPKQIVEEANHSAATLAEMSKKVSAVVGQLSTVNGAAEQRREELNRASATADDKLDQLKHHTTRVGQLVGIIRQLYGTMDARIERLRSRLTQADSLFRNVPQEIEHLRQVLGEEATGVEAARVQAAEFEGARPQAAEVEGARARTAVQNLAAAANNRASPANTQQRPKPAPAATRERAPAAERAAPATTSTSRKAAPPVGAPATPAKDSLGERVRRNQKLNEWLRDVLGEEGIKTAGELKKPAERAVHEPAAKK